MGFGGNFRFLPGLLDFLVENSAWLYDLFGACGDGEITAVVSRMVDAAGTLDRRVGCWNACDVRNNAKNASD